MKPKTYFPFIYLLIFAGLLYNFREKGLFLGGQNVISWGGTRGYWGAFAPPACMLKKALRPQSILQLRNEYIKKHEAFHKYKLRDDFEVTAIDIQWKLKSISNVFDLICRWVSNLAGEYQIIPAGCRPIKTVFEAHLWNNECYSSL